MLPSLLKSPTARPRAAKAFVNTDPASALTFRNRPPSLRNSSSGSLLFHLLGVVFDHVIGMTVCQQQVDISIVVVIEEFQSPPLRSRVA